MVVIVLADLYRLMNSDGDDWWVAIINFIVPLIFLVVFLCYFISFKNIQKVLYP